MLSRSRRERGEKVAGGYRATGRGGARGKGPGRRLVRVLAGKSQQPALPREDERSLPSVEHRRVFKAMRLLCVVL